MTAHADRWTPRLAALAAEFGAGLAFWHNGRVHACAAGVLNAATGTSVIAQSPDPLGNAVAEGVRGRAEVERLPAAEYTRALLAAVPRLVRA